MCKRHAVVTWGLCLAKWVVVAALLSAEVQLALWYIRIKSNWVGFVNERRGRMSTEAHEKMIGLLQHFRAVLWVPTGLCLGLCAWGCARELRGKGKTAGGLLAGGTACVVCAVIFGLIVVDLSAGYSAALRWKPVPVVTSPPFEQALPATCARATSGPPALRNVGPGVCIPERRPGPVSGT